MVTIKRGFSVKDVNNYKIVTEKKAQEENGKRLVSKIEKVEYKNPKLVTFGNVYRVTQENAPDVLKNVKIFEIPNPYELDVESGNYNNIVWNLEQSVLAVKEGYADGFHISSNIFGKAVSPFKVVDPIQAVKVQGYFLGELKDWIKKIDETPFSYVATITTHMSTFEIGKSNDPKDAVTPENIKATAKYLKESNPDDIPDTNYEALAKKLLERLYYSYNIINAFGDRTADNLEFDTYEEAAKFARWLRTTEGVYDGENYINSGACLVNHGFQDWIAKKNVVYKD